MFVLCTQYIIAANAGENYNVTSIKCYGDVIVNFRSEVNITDDEYKFIGCTQQDEEYWKCKCNQGKSLLIQLYTKPKTENIYDIKLSYYIEPKQPEDDDKTTQTKAELENDLNSRTKSFTNIRIGPPPKKSFSELIPSKNFVPIVIGIIIFAIVLAIVGGYYIFKLITKDDGSMNIYQPPSNVKTKQETDMTDEEILEYIRNNAK